MIKIVTYNLMHGLHSAQLLENIRSLINHGADIVCLKEYDSPFDKAFGEFLTTLPQVWQVTAAQIGRGGNVAMAWNTGRLRQEHAEIIPLPVLSRPALSQRLRPRPGTIHRVALSCSFALEDKVFRITTLHLAWEGGLAQRLRQLRYLINNLNKNALTFDIICGDFNTMPPRLWQRWQQKKIAGILGSDYVNAFPDIRWTYDNTYFSPQDGLVVVTKLCRSIGIRFRSRLDYLFLRNVEVIRGGMVELPGSDHRPIAATLSFRNTDS